MKLTLFFAISALAFGQSVMPIEKVARLLNADESAPYRSQIERIGKAHRSDMLARKNAMQAASQQGAGPAYKQAPGVIIVVGSSNTGNTSVTVAFQSVKPLAIGTVVVYQIVLPDGTQIPVSTYQVTSYGPGIAPPEGFNVSTQMWNGSFPSIWASGGTTFGVLTVSPSGDVGYVSAVVPVSTCCYLNGPVERADVSLDGNNVVITGLFTGDTYAVVNGNPVGILFPAEDVHRKGSISLADLGEGEMVLTVSSGGSSSTRIIYVTRSSSAKGD